MEARRSLWFVDSKGLVVAGRTDLAQHKLGYAHEHPPMDLISAIKELRPSALIGATGAAGTFTQDVLRSMADISERPIVFALSNPTANAECTAEEAYRWTDGRAVFASGSPFDPVEFDGNTFVPGQSNNAYIFPGVGLAVVATKATRVTDKMFLAAARALANAVRSETLGVGSLYPPLKEIREVSVEIACAVAEVAFQEGLAAASRPDNIEELIRSRVWEPTYQASE
jgi:malate dehydrogenase (oxaloacetate-decarboxylating)(NADP+)